MELASAFGQRSLPLQALEQDDVVGDGFAGDGEALAVAGPGEGGNGAAVGEVRELMCRCAVERLHPQICLRISVNVRDAPTVGRPTRWRAPISAASRFGVLRTRESRTR